MLSSEHLGGSISISPTKAPAFFSYARKDSAFALRLAADLKQAGANVWLDQLDIRPGRQWDREVENALHACSEMIVVLTPAAVESRNVMDEIGFALDEEKTIIPLILAECRVPLRLRRVQHIDIQPDYEAGLHRLLTSLAADHPSYDAEAFNNRGIAWYNQREYVRAVRDYTRALRLEPHYVEALYNRGLAWQDQGEYDRAINDYTKAIELNPTVALAFNNRGNVLRRQRDYDRAIGDYNQAIALEPEYADAFFNRGLAWSGKNNKANAIADFQRASSLYGPHDPSQEDARAELKKLGVNQP